MKTVLALTAVLAVTPGVVSAQANQIAAVAYYGLPTNTEVLVTLNDQLTSKNTRKGQLFDVSVSRDVMVGGRVVIPRGTPGKGEIVYRTGKGAFGKSGKLELVLRSLDVNGRALPLTGRFRQEGQGNTGAVLGTIVLAGVVAGAFATGHSAVIEQGREFKAFTAEAWPSQAPTLQVAALQVAPMPRPLPVVASRPIIASVATVAPGVMRAAPVAYTPPADAYSRALAAQRGVRGYNAVQGWTISD